MTLAERLADAHRRSVVFYQRLTALEQQRQQVQASFVAVQQEMLAIDGEVRILEVLLKETTPDA